MWIVLSSLLITLIWFKFFRRKRDYYGNIEDNPKSYKKLTESEHAILKAHCKKLIEKDSENITGEIYPDLKEEVIAVKKYQKLLSDYESGKIDVIEFQLKSSKLIEKINISDLVTNN